jgi:hypothetical protein
VSSFPVLFLPLFISGRGGAPTGFGGVVFFNSNINSLLIFLSFFFFFDFFLKEFSSIFTEGECPHRFGGRWEVFLFFGFPAGDYPRSVLVEGGILFHV